MHNAQSLKPDPIAGDFEILETAVAKFKARHPYLLFHKRAVPGICKRANDNPKLIARLAGYLRHPSPAPAGEEHRTAIKRQARRLINTSFMALISDGDRRIAALEVTRSILHQFTSAASWKERPVIKSFLDCAEIAVAVALAYDWLYDALIEKERETIEHALFRHVLEPALAAYDDQSLLWPRWRCNCTTVSNSGILIVSLALLRSYPDMAVKLLERILVSSRNNFAAFAPDGAWPEGLSYWSLTVRYASLMVAALESVFGDSFGLAERPGFAQTGDFALHMVGPFGAAFNFGDSERRFDASPLAWFAHRFKRPDDGQLIGGYDGWYLPFTVIWPGRSKTASARSGPVRADPSTGKIFRGGDVACFRNTWSTDTGSRPVYLAIKGGNAAGRNNSSPGPDDVVIHTQADAGSFVVDGARQRWVVDLGGDDYDLPGYFDHGTGNGAGMRWRYYRTQTAGHNTLVFDGRNQIPNTQAPIIANCVAGPSKWVVFDLSAAYGKPAGSIRRGAALIGRQVVIQDEIGPMISGNIVWSVHTTAEPISVDGLVAQFQLGDDKFAAQILEPSDAKFTLALPPPPQSFPIADVRQLHGRAPVADPAEQISELPRREDAEGGRATGPLISTIGDRLAAGRAPPDGAAAAGLR